MGQDTVTTQRMWESNARPVKLNSSVILCYSSLTLTVDSSYREGSIRLVGGAYNWEGRVEIYWMGEWGTVSAGNSSWTAAEAEVVCRQLGHSTNGEYRENFGLMHVYTCSHV